MRIERTKNATRNIVFGVFLKLYQTIIPFFMRSAMIYFMGVQYLGLTSLFASILQVLNLAELGVGNAMVYSMYKPIVEDDTVTICALMKLYRFYYRIIGGVIASVGIILTPFIPKLISGEVPYNINIYTLYLLNLSATVLSYWLFGYKNSLLVAHQRNDLTSKVTIVTNTFQYVLQLGVLLFFKNYYMYVIAALFTQATTNIVTAIVATKMYPRYKPIGRLSKDDKRKINHRIRDLFTSKIGGVILNSSDTIIISAFLGLTVLAVYQNYYFILTSVIGFITIVFNSCTAGIGNSIITETKDKNFNDLVKLTFLICWISGFCTSCFLCLYQPFMELWVGKEMLLPFNVVICFCIYYFIYEINQLLNTFKDAAGIWHEDRFRPFTTALFNLCMNLLLINVWGIYGVILSTILSWIIVGMPWLLHNLFSILFDRVYLRVYLRKLGYFTMVSLGVCSITGFISSFINYDSKLITLLVRMIICCLVPNIIYFIIFHEKLEFLEWITIFNRITRGKLRLTRLICRL